MKIQKEFDVVQASTTVRIEKAREDVTPVVEYTKFISKGIEINGEVVNQRLEAVLPENTGTTLFQDVTANGVDINEAVANTTAKATVEYAEKTGQRAYIEMKLRQPAERPENGSTPVLPQVASPVITFDSTDGNLTATATIACATDGATIFYTTGSGTPDTEYTGPISLTETTTIKAKATKDEYRDSATISKTFTKGSITVASPTVAVGSDGTVTITVPSGADGAKYVIGSGNAQNGTTYDASNKPVLTNGQTIYVVAYKTVSGTSYYSSPVTKKYTAASTPTTSTIYHGYLINEDPNKMYASQAFTDADVLSQITSNAFTSETVADSSLSSKVINYPVTSREEGAAGYSFAVYAYPKSLGNLTAYDNDDDDPTPIDDPTNGGNGLFDNHREITINGVVYNVYIEASGEYRDEIGSVVTFRFMK